MPFQTPPWFADRRCNVGYHWSFLTLQQEKAQWADPQFCAILAEMRFGRLSPEACTALRERVQTQQSEPPPTTSALVPTKMCSRNAEVDHENERCLRLLPGKSQVFVSQDTGSDGGALHALQSSCPAAARIELKVGAQVVFLFSTKLARTSLRETPKNVDADMGIVNGTRGIITGFVHQQAKGLSTTVPLPVVRVCRSADQSMTHTVELTTWETRRSPTATEHARLQALGEEEHTERARIMDNLIIARRKQLPLRLAWALSIHKCQGMTLDAIELSMRHIFEYGQAYVAFSRARSLSSVHLQDFFPSKIKAHPLVCAFYEAMAPNVDPDMSQCIQTCTQPDRKRLASDMDTTTPM